MFDFDVGKLVVIGAVALVVIGPKDLPRVLRQVGQVVGKMRRMANEFQSQFMEAMREADVDDVKKEVEKLADSARLDFDPLKDVRTELSSVENQISQVNSDVSAAIAGDTAPHAPETVAETPAALEPPAVDQASTSHEAPGFEHAPAAEQAEPAKIAAQEILGKIRPQAEHGDQAGEHASADGEHANVASRKA